MESTTYLIGSQMSSLIDSLDVVASNVANANTAGFKRSLSQFTTVLAAAQAAGKDPGGLATAWEDWPALDGSWLDLSQGPVQRTGRPLDLAIQGEGFFVVDTPEGRRYTRKGRMHLNTSKELVDGAGNRFQSDSGPLSIPDDARDVTIGPDGSVVADEEELGRLMVVEFAQPELLVKEGSATFRNDGPLPTPVIETQVIQGAIEQSNVNPVHEMVALMSILRAYEAAARIMKRSDSLQAQLVQATA